MLTCTTPSFSSSLLAAIILTAAQCIYPITAQAGDEGTIVFRDGFAVRFEDGFRQIAAALKGSGNSTARAVEITSGSQTFVVNVSEIALICRDRCTNLTFQGIAGPSKSGATSNDSNRASIAIEQNQFLLQPRSQQTPPGGR